MESFEYSVLIRTLGKAGKKYQALLDSIDKQKIKPKEVIVVIPYGYDLPQERLGYERFVRSQKGMISQRVMGLDEVKSRYCLFFDDDLSFDDTFVEALANPVLNSMADVTFPILKELLPQSTGVRTICTLLCTAIPAEKKCSFSRIVRSGGYSYNPDVIEGLWYEAQTAPGACFFCSTETMRSIHFEEELWLEKTEYALPDDQVMFYKFHKKGFKIYGKCIPNYVHLDAGGCSPDRGKKASFAMSCNKTIFWHRFIWTPDKNIFSKLLSLCCFLYSTIACFIYGLMKACAIRNFDLVKSSLKGYNQAYCFLKSDEYKQIPPIIK